MQFTCSTRLWIIAFAMLCVSGLCNAQISTDTTAFNREIPLYKDGTPSIFYELVQKRVRQLDIDTLQNGYDSLQIRIWYDYALVNYRYVFVLKRTGAGWTAVIYTVFVDWDGNAETIKQKKVQQLQPKNGWDSFLSKFFALQVTTLPNMDDISGLQDNWTDGITYDVEVATKTQYRFYEYHLPEKFADEYWQAGKMVDILKLLQAEFGVVSGLRK